MNAEQSNVVIVVPVYKNSFSDDELISFKSMLRNFKNRDVIIVHPKRLDKTYIENLVPGRVGYEEFDDSFFKDTRTYNRLLMSIDFYHRFEAYEHMVICQLDVYVIKDDIDYWVQKGYDYVGAPVFEGYTNASLKIKEKGANGGFCFRNIKASIQVLESIGFTYSKLTSLWKMESTIKWKLIRIIRDGILYNYKVSFLKPIVNEDMFWSVLVPDKFAWFKVCGPEESKFFSYDANPRHLYDLSNNIYPMAIHAWWRYDRPFVEEVIANTNN